MDRPDAAADSAPPVAMPADDAGTVGATGINVGTTDVAPVAQDAGTPPAVDVAPVARPQIAFMVGAPAAPTAVEVQMRQRLETRGLDVRYLADTAVASDASTAALILISATVHSPSFTVGFHNLAKPILVMKASLFDELGMTGPTRGADSGEDNTTALLVVSEEHPLAAGLGGLVQIVPGTVAWGRPPAGAVRVAVLSAEPTKVALFAYERGAAMVDRPAAARRVGFFATDRSGVAGSDAAMRLFDAAVDWARR
jgi:hypothetical protein